MDDHDDEFVAALKVLGELLTKSKPDDLKSLLSGEASLGVVPKGWRIMPPGSRAPSSTTKQPKVEIPPASRIRVSILEAPHADRARLLRELGMNATQARTLAKELGVPRAGRSTIDQAIEKIVDYFADASVSPDNHQRY